MKNIKILPISIATIILVAFLAVSFTIFDASEEVSIKGVASSYAETYAKENHVEFIAIDDSENPNIEISTTEKETTTKKAEETTEAESTPKQTKKENDEFSYNYENDTISITAYKGTASVVTIPDTIDNLPVKEIGFGVLGKGITTVQIPESVTSIKTDFISPRYNTAFYAVIAVMVLGYIFAIISTFIGLRKSKTAEATFYGIPFVYSGLVTYIVITIWCGVALFFGFNPLLQAVVAIIIFACALGKLLKKTAARELIEQRGEQVKQQMQFIKLLTADADSLVSAAKTDEAKTLAKKVYEAIRYSDPMSMPELKDIETEIKNKFSAFSDAIMNNSSSTETIANDLIVLIYDRNSKCKVLKQ